MNPLVRKTQHLVNNCKEELKVLYEYEREPTKIEFQQFLRLCGVIKTESNTIVRIALSRKWITKE